MLRRVSSLLVLLLPSLAVAQVTPFQTISATTSGPLTDIFVGDEGSLQIAHVLDPSAYQVYPPSSRPGDYGTILSVNGIMYGPAFDAHEDGSATGNLSGAFNYEVYVPVMQTGVLGAGTALDPYRVVTTYTASTAHLELSETTSYLTGQESFLTELVISNTGTSAQSGIVYRAADCYLGGSDSGYGFYDAATGAIACSENANNSPTGRIEQWLPISQDSHYFQSGYSSVWTQIATGAQLPDSCQCNTLLDNGAGLSWSFTVPVGGSVIRSHLTTFSVVGNLPLTTLKLADAPEVAPGGTTGYTLFFDNPNLFAVTLTDIVDTLPAGFSYLAGTTTGLVATDPAINGSQLTWAGPASVPGQATGMLHFNVVVATATGTYYNNAGAAAQGGISVAPTGDTAPVLVTTTPADGGVVPFDDGGPGPDTGSGDGMVQRDTGVEPEDTGVPEDDSGVPPTPDTGVPPGADTGVPPAADTGVPPAADTGVPPAADTGVGPAVDGGIGGASDATGGTGASESAGDEGCSCSASEPSRPSGLFGALSLLAVLALRRRRSP